VVIGRAARRASREAIVVKSFGSDRSSAALDLLEFVELAWHDCSGEITPPDEVIDDILVVAGGDLGRRLLGGTANPRGPCGAVAAAARSH
jgi:hypothetical protein